jgi:hypothetical protein
MRPKRVMQKPNYKWVFLRAFFLLFCGALLLWNVYLAFMMFNINMNDFGKFYYSAVGFLQGRNLYDINPAMPVLVSPLEYKIFLNLNPPHFMLLILPLAFFSPNIALLLWSLINLFFFIVSIIIIFQEVKVKLNLQRVIILVVVLLAFAGTGAVVVTGQLSFIMMFLITIFWVESRQNNWNKGAIFLGLAISIKMFLLIFIPYLLLRKKWLSFLITISVALSVFVLGILLFGIDSHLIWLKSLQLVDWTWASMNVSIHGFLSRLFDNSPYYQPIIIKPQFINPLWIFCVSLVGIFTFPLIIGDNGKKEVDRSYAMLLTIAQLISPLGWIYYLWFVIGPITALGVGWYKNWHEKYEYVKPLLVIRNSLLLFAISGFLIPLTFLLSFQPNALITFTLGSIYFWATLALWASLIADRFLDLHMIPLNIN